jgi:hypothetical protein
MCTNGGKNAPIFENIDVDIMKRVIGQVRDAELKQLCEKVINKEVFSMDDLISEKKTRQTITKH